MSNVHNSQIYAGTQKYVDLQFFFQFHFSAIISLNCGFISQQNILLTFKLLLDRNKTQIAVAIGENEIIKWYSSKIIVGIFIYWNNTTGGVIKY